jgi:hypothetical protein
MRAKAGKMLARMTLDEKKGQMSQLDLGISGSEQLKQAVRTGGAVRCLISWELRQFNEFTDSSGGEQTGHTAYPWERCHSRLPHHFPHSAGYRSFRNPEAVRQAFRIFPLRHRHTVSVGHLPL